MRPHLFLGHDNVTELLIQSGADLNIAKYRGNTALMWAAQKGSEKIIQMLIEKGANMNAVDENGNSAIIFAARKGNDELFHVVITYSNLISIE